MAEPLPKDDQEPPSSLADETDLLAKISRRYREMDAGSSKWREDAKTDFEFVAGRQWDSDSLRLLRDQQRPALTFNRVHPLVQVVTGMEVSNRQEVKYYPRQIGDAQISDVLCAAAKWVRDECSAEDEESDMFLDAVICGMGWTVTRLDYSDDLDGKIIIERVDPMEVWWDNAAQKRNLSDARDFIRIRNVSRAYLKETWPEKADEVTIGNLWMGGRPGLTLEDSSDEKYAGDGSEPERDLNEIKLVEYQWCEMETVYRVMDPQTGQMIEMPFERLAVATQQYKAMGQTIQYVKQQRRRWYMAIASGQVLLQKTDCPDPYSPMLRACTGYRDHMLNQFYGIVRHMRDPQAWANKWLSQALHIINSNAKGGLLVEEGAVSDMNKFSETYAKADGVTFVTNGAVSGQRIMPKVPAPFPEALANVMRLAIDSIREVSGITQESVGQQESAQVSGALEFQRKQTSMSVLASIFDSLRRYRKEQGRTLLALIQTYLNDGRLIRIAGEKGEEYKPLQLDPAIAKYDIVVDEAPTSPNQRERVWQVLNTILPQAAQLGMPIPVEVLEYLPIPASLSAAWREKVQPSQPDPMQQQLAQAQLEQMMLGNQLTKAQIDSLYGDITNKSVTADAKAMDTEARLAETAAKIGSMQADTAATVAGIGESQMRAQSESARARKEQFDTAQLMMRSKLEREKLMADAVHQRVALQAQMAQAKLDARRSEMEMATKLMLAKQQAAVAEHGMAIEERKAEMETGPLAKARMFAEVLSDAASAQKVISELSAMGIPPSSLMALIAQAIETTRAAEGVQP